MANENSGVDQMANENNEVDHRRPIFRLKIAKGTRVQRIPIGPYHPEKFLLKAMGVQEEKHKCFESFKSKYTNVDKPLSALLPDLYEKRDDLMKYYPDLENPYLLIKHPVIDWSPEEFLEMMIRDACYILEGMRLIPRREAFTYQEMIILRRDLLQYSNQIPLSVLNCVYSVQEGSHKKDSNRDLINLIRCFFGFDLRDMEGRKCMHILDIYRHSLFEPRPLPPNKTPTPTPPPPHPVQRVFNIPSATKLIEGRIKIKKSPTQSRLNIQFDKKTATLSLPRIDVTYENKNIYGNLVMFEKHGGSGSKEFSSYMCFMSALLKDTADCTHMVERGIIVSTWADNEVIDMFHELSWTTDLNYEVEMDNMLVETGQSVRECYDGKSVEWKAVLYGSYLNNRVGIIALIAAVLVFILNAVQTAYTVAGYYK